MYIIMINDKPDIFGNNNPHIKSPKLIFNDLTFIILALHWILSLVLASYEIFQRKVHSSKILLAVLLLEAWGNTWKEVNEYLRLDIGSSIINIYILYNFHKKCRLLTCGILDRNRHKIEVDRRFQMFHRLCSICTQYIAMDISLQKWSYFQ